MTAVTALLVRPVAGALADRHGHRTVMLAGALVVAAGGLLYLLPLSVPALVAVRLLLGAGEAALFTAGAVWTVALAPHHRRGQLIGLYGVSMWGGISAGTFLGATLQQVSFTAVWVLSAAAPLIAAGLIAMVPTPPRTAPTGGGGGLAAAAGAAARDRPHLRRRRLRRARRVRGAAPRRPRHRPRGGGAELLQRRLRRHPAGHRSPARPARPAPGGRLVRGRRGGRAGRSSRSPPTCRSRSSAA